jgi:tripartite-type tricarboxylate transporter receptor subunit TctC
MKAVKLRSLAAQGGMALISLVALAAMPAAHAQSWPSRPIKVIVPGAPGASTDVLGRITAQALGERLGVAVIVENRPGANGAIGLEAVARSAPDGYTLLWTGQDTQILGPIMRKNLPYDVERDFQPLAKIGDLYLLFATNPNNPAKTLKDFVATAKANPGQLKFSSSGEGGINQLMVELLKQRAGIDMLHIPYRGGSPAVQALVAGDVDLYGGSTTNLSALIGGGKLRGLAIAKETRAATLPNVPTMAESGYPDFIVSGWFAMYSPAGLPEPIATKLSETLVAIANEPAFAAKFAAAGAETAPLGRAAFTRYVADDMKRWRAVVEAAGIKPLD